MSQIGLRFKTNRVETDMIILKICYNRQDADRKRNKKCSKTNQAQRSLQQNLLFIASTTGNKGGKKMIENFYYLFVLFQL